MGRARSEANADLPANLYINAAGYFYFKNPHTNRMMGLRRDRAAAIETAEALNKEISPITEKILQGRTKSIKTNRRFDADGLVDAAYLKANSTTFEKVCGVYFLMLDGDVVYIGQSINCNYRISVHISGGKKEFDGCYIIRAEPETLDNLEAQYIHKFKPRYNMLIPKKTSRDAWGIEQRLEQRETF
jgi:hypothetical protein